MPSRPRRSSLLFALSVPIIIADAGPRCGGSGPRRPPPEDATQGDTSRVMPEAGHDVPAELTPRPG